MADIQRWTVTEPYIDMKCGLGEAPFYETKTHNLRFVDIVKEKFHVVNLDEGPKSLQSWDLGTPVSTTADIDNNEDDIIVGAKACGSNPLRIAVDGRRSAFDIRDGFAYMNRATKRLTYINHVWEDEDGPGKGDRMRFNDGFVDPKGRFFAGIMNDPKVKEPTNEGVLFRLDPDLSLHRVLKAVSIPNGMGITLDQSGLYFIDSPTKNIWKYKYNRDTGDISEREIFYHVENDGVPDGMVMDVKGCLWVALAGGGSVLKLSPGGNLIGIINLPTRMISCPAFAGEELFITSAEEEEPDKYPESVKFGGSLFKVNVGVEGLPVHKFGTARA